MTKYKKNHIIIKSTHKSAIAQNLKLLELLFNSSDIYLMCYYADVIFTTPPGTNI